MAKKRNPYKLIYNPKAGKKRSALTLGNGTTIEGIKKLLAQYQIPVDFYPSGSFKQARELAEDSLKEGYETVIVVGGDGTVGQVANGLVNTNVTLAVIPMGTFMNVARMFSIPTEIEKAVMLIKLGRKRKIDVGLLTKINGEKLEDPLYFLESAGIGLDAEIQKIFLNFEKSKLKTMFGVIKEFIRFLSTEVDIFYDKKKIVSRASIINIANGPFTGAALKLAPKAKLNDHVLTVTLYEMSKLDLLRYIYNMTRHKKTDLRKVKSFQAEKVRVLSKRERLVHADARQFGTTPTEFRIIPGALTVITGFPTSVETASLKERHFIAE